MGKPSWLSVSAWVALVAVVVYLIFAATHKTDSENYAKGASHLETTTTIAPVQNNYPCSIPGCSPFLALKMPDGSVRYVDDKGKPIEVKK
jgi:hypothetical protein